MHIIYERTRIIFSEYTPQEKHKIDNLVATSDKVFHYEDVDNQKIYLPTGMLNSVKKLFSNTPIEDKSSTHWDYATIQPVEHSAEPRNQLQIDFINYLLEQVKIKKKVAGILSPG